MAPPYISKSFHVLSECPLLLPNPSLIQDFIMDSGSGVDLSSLSGPTRQQKGLKVLGYQGFFDGLCVGDHVQPSVFEVIREGTPLLALEGDQ